MQWAGALFAGFVVLGLRRSNLVTTGVMVVAWALVVVVAWFVQITGQ